MTGPPQLWLVRHGATEWRAARRHTGRTDVALVPDGEADARALAPRLAEHRFALALTSPLRRARDTAALAGFPDATVDPDLREWDYGEYEGRTTEEIRERVPGWTLWTSDPPGGETAEQVAVRARRVIDRCREGDGDILLFAHGHVLRVLTAVYLEFDPHAGAQFALETATLNVLGHEHEYPTLRRWNG